MGQHAGHERVFVQCLPGLESVLRAEAGHLGAIHPVAGGIEVEGPAGVHAEAALVLRVAERVLLRLVEFPVRRWSEVEVGLRSVRLDGVAEPGAEVVVETSIRLPGAPAPRTLAATLTRSWRRPVRAAGADERAGEKPRVGHADHRGRADGPFGGAGTGAHVRGGALASCGEGRLVRKEGPAPSARAAQGHGGDRRERRERWSPRDRASQCAACGRGR